MLILEPRGVRHHRYKYRPIPPYPRLSSLFLPPTHNQKKGRKVSPRGYRLCLEGHISPPGPICQSFLLCVALFFFPFALYLFALFVTL